MRAVTDDLREQLALHRVPGIGPHFFQTLLSRFGSADEALRASSSALKALGIPEAVITAMAQPDWNGVDADQAWAEQPDHHVLTLSSPDYPEMLRAIPAAPPLLFVTGHPDVLSTPQLAIIGSRNPTSGGRQNAHDFARHLAASGLTITSGLATGVDTAAHEGALAADGLTIAATATGPDRVYPAANRRLARSIAERGAMVTEFPVGVAARAEHFPRRNRIISGLSAGVLVVEAGVRSGSLITARYALDQDREVFAIPGSIHNPMARGCHALIRAGAAKLVEKAADIMEELPSLLAVNLSSPQRSEQLSVEDAAMDEDHQRVMEALGHDPTTLESVLQRTGLTPEAVSSILLILELQGHVTAMPGGRYALTGTRT
ncbi:MAG: DNA-processing protein DprA [Aquisalimonadaceae bacterium]